MQFLNTRMQQMNFKDIQTNYKKIKNQKFKNLISNISKILVNCNRNTNKTQKNI